MDWNVGGIGNVALGVGVALVAGWLLLVVTLVVVRPETGLLREALRILPDLLRLLRRLSADAGLPRGVRVRLGLLMLYLAMPIDLIPDFIPVLGYADDVIVVAAVLRGVVRRAGLEAVRGHWPGTPAGFDVLCRLTGLGPSGPGR
ncbi:YkvA family protein [Streptosporangium sp. DT93]|uniref:YkvA family protein n=1 Tax=Streptosporangium sp. DT93 TaxID=3393428 RepID=UPI003CE7C181